MFMSDGQDSSGEDEMRELRAEICVLTPELVVKTVAFGQVDPGKLKALADAGAGEFMHAVDGMQLKMCFEKAAASLVKTHFQ